MYHQFEWQLCLIGYYTNAATPYGRRYRNERLGTGGLTLHNEA